VSARIGELPAGVEALLLLTVEEIAVNDLRETFHHWVRTFALPFAEGKLGEPMPHRPAIDWRLTDDKLVPEAKMQKALELWDESREGLAELLKTHALGLNKDLRLALEKDRQVALDNEQERFKQRQGELSKLIQDTTAQRLEREIEDLKSDLDQLGLFDVAGRELEHRRLIEDKEEELRRRRSQLEGLRQMLETERQRIISFLIPKRFALANDVLVLPVALEIRMRGV
jgi:hypothetical protein